MIDPMTPLRDVRVMGTQVSYEDRAKSAVDCVTCLNGGKVERGCCWPAIGRRVFVTRLNTSLDKYPT
jgi:hypothetical protein